eukprot:CAMPEP_0114695000 /NCGR_PEP_ID=MMETSP0191-20121206/70857_1 /TAXON_ID=126664 /ORGANISM="Sorites sp." /LENGTH=56 /DNA_ID=CAMNT_0001990679 /DNA_START=39 /DNA_END=206 /DNA_ORIENTATION=+
MGFPAKATIAAGGMITPSFLGLSYQHIAISTDPSNAHGAVCWHLADLNGEDVGACS